MCEPVHTQKDQSSFKLMWPPAKDAQPLTPPVGDRVEPSTCILVRTGHRRPKKHIFRHMGVFLPITLLNTREEYIEGYKEICGHPEEAMLMGGSLRSQRAIKHSIVKIDVGEMVDGGVLPQRSALLWWAGKRRSTAPCRGLPFIDALRLSWGKKERCLPKR